MSNIGRHCVSSRWDVTFNSLRHAEEILRDRLLFGIRDNKVRERLLREPRLTLAKTDEICREAESLDAQMKTITDGLNTLVNTVKPPPRMARRTSKVNKGNKLYHQVSQTYRSVGTVGANMTHTRGSYVQRLARCATGVINLITLQRSAVALQAVAQ